MGHDAVAGSRIRKAGIAITCSVVIGHVVLAVVPLDDVVAVRISTLVYLAGTLWALSLAMMARRGITGRECAIWTYASLAASGFVFAALWRVYGVYTAGWAPLGTSPQDLGLIVGFVFLTPVVASLGNPVHASLIRRIGSAIDMLGMGIIALIATYALVITPLGAIDPGRSALRNLLFSAFLVLSVAFAGYPVVYRRDPWTPRARLMLAAIWCAAVGLILNAWVIRVGAYAPGGAGQLLDDTFLIAAYLLFGLAALWRFTAVLDSPAAPSPAEDVPRWPGLVVASMSVFGIPVSMWAALRSDDALYAAVLGSAASVLAVLLVLRTALILVENRRLGAADATASRYRTLVESSPSGVLVIDGSGTVVFANATAARHLDAASPYDLIGMPMRRFIVPGGESSRGFLEIAHMLERVARDPGGRQENLPPAVIGIWTLAGRRVMIERTVAAIIYDGEAAILIQGVDVTARVDAEAAAREYADRLSELAADLIATEERERRQLAQALHDHVGQPLAVARMRLKAAQSEGALVGEDALVSLQMLERAIAQTRSLTTELAPQILYELGVAEALRSLCDEYAQAYSIVCSIEGKLDDADVGDEARAALYRSVREAMTNVIKHAHTDRMRLEFADDRAGITVRVVDEGAGFDTEIVKRRGGTFGLFSIRERIPHLGGRVTITSRPGRGTTVAITVPRSHEER